MNIDTLVPGSGRELREDNSVINNANYLAPVPNGDETITVYGPGVKTLTPPTNDLSIRADIVMPVDAWVRFGADPEVNVGEYFPKGSKCKLMSKEEIKGVRIRLTNSCLVFVQYFK